MGNVDVYLGASERCCILPNCGLNEGTNWNNMEHGGSAVLDASEEKVFPCITPNVKLHL